MGNFVFVGYGRDALLIGQGGVSFEPFAHYRDVLSQKNVVSESTLHGYLGHVHRFIEYIHAAAQLDIPTTEQNLSYIISRYESYLLYAGDSTDPIVSKISSLTGRKKGCEPSSLPAIESALIHFLRTSDNRARESGRDGLFSKYMPGMYKKVSHGEAMKLREGSMLGGLLSGGQKRRRKAEGNLFSTTRRLKREFKKPFKDVSFIFPFDRVIELIETTNSYRDKAIYALLASSGMRTSEALQITFKDVDFDKRTLRSVNPLGRSHIGITETETRNLKYKGRVRPGGNPEDVFLIPPYDDYFFLCLSQYLEKEYIKGQSHNFIFQKMSGVGKGRPYFSSDRSTRVRNFNRRAARIGVDLPKGVSIHSLRHGIATYLLNDIETPSGKGLPLIVVSYLLGHTDIKTTETYAKRDKETVLRSLKEVSDLFYGKNNFHDIISVLTNKVAK